MRVKTYLESKYIEKKGKAWKKVELVCLTNHINSSHKNNLQSSNQWIRRHKSEKNIVTKISKAIFKYLILLRIKYVLTIKQNENIWQAKRLKD